VRNWYLAAVLAVLLTTAAWAGDSPAGKPHADIVSGAASKAAAPMASPSAAEPSAAAEEPELRLAQGESLDWGRQISVTLIWLVVVCGGAWLILRVFYAKAGGMSTFGGFGTGARRRYIRVLERNVISPQKALLLVDVAGRVLLLGVSEQQIRTLAELDADDLEAGASQPVGNLRAPRPSQGLTAVPRPADDPAPRPGENSQQSFQEQVTSLFGRRDRPEE